MTSLAARSLPEIKTWTGTLALLLACGMSAEVRASDQSVQATKLTAITVPGVAIEDPLSPSRAAARAQLHQWPGNVSLVAESDYTGSATQGLRDALSREPGIYVQSAAGQQSAKLSIRGSGLASPLGVRGVALLRD
ncbi:MAG TPA: Plug domain-containing protein, partial [Burkholderiaceae bacterium]|nr:Plug domain-containing protein [Burkholderiaceae bacterium]